MMSTRLAYNQFLFLGRPELRRSPVVSLRSSLMQFKSERRGRLCIQAAASSSLTGSGAEYSEPLSGAQKKKGRRIAGVDQDELVDPKLLADPDSYFCEFEGVQIHHKICDPESSEENALHGHGASSDLPHQTKERRFPLILLHGFGASLFSWSAVMKHLAKVAGTKVLSFDRPAFGLTSRVQDPFNHATSRGSQDTKALNPYSMAFSVLATLYFIDFLAAEKTILIGHSAGCLVAAETYFQAPERVAALILVAPAIVAPLISPKKDTGNEDDKKNSESRKNPVSTLFSILSKFSRFIAQTVMHLVKGMADMLDSLYKKALSALLRSRIAVMLVRMVIDKFGIAAVKNAWYDQSLVTDSVLNNYTRPLRTKGWDRALVEYTAAMLTGSGPQSKPPLQERLKEVSCPVLIITGDNDRLVPAWNSQRLSQAIPGSHLEVIKNCGHLPQEEKPQEFVTIVDKFLQSIFVSLEPHPLQPAI